MDETVKEKTAHLKATEKLEVLKALRSKREGKDTSILELKRMMYKQYYPDIWEEKFEKDSCVRVCKAYFDIKGIEFDWENLKFL